MALLLSKAFDPRSAARFFLCCNQNVGIDLGPYAPVKVHGNTIGFIKDFDAGMVGGLRFQLSEKFGLTGRYCIGLTPLYELASRDANNNNNGEIKLYNRNIQVGITHAFRMRK